MSPPVTKSGRHWLAALPFSGGLKAALHLDIGRQQISLHDGKETQTICLGNPLKTGRSLAADLPFLQQAIESLLYSRGKTILPMDI